MNRRRWLALSLHAWDQGWNLSKQGADLEELVEISAFADIMLSQKGSKKLRYLEDPKKRFTTFPTVGWKIQTSLDATRWWISRGCGRRGVPRATPSRVWKWLKLCSTFLGTLPFPDGFSHQDLIFICFFFGHFSMQIIIQPSLALGFRYPGTSSPAVAVSDKESVQNDPRNQNKTTTIKPSPIVFDFETVLCIHTLRKLNNSCEKNGSLFQAIRLSWWQLFQSARNRPTMRGMAPGATVGVELGKL